MEVHDYLGPGYTEAFYFKAVCHELASRRIEFRAEVSIEVANKDALIDRFRLDLIVEGRLIVELKAVEPITNVHLAQAAAYLKASGLHAGLIVNFNVSRLLHGVRRVRWPR